MTKYQVPKDRMFITTDYMRKRYGRYDPNVFKRWEQAGEVEKVRNGLYLSQDYNPFHDTDYFSIANKMYAPSYVSTISALRYWSLIPETVYSITSVTTKKTKNFEYRSTQFTYQHIKPELFFGYEVVKWEGTPYAIAEPEKAILDLAYLEPLFSDRDWLEEMRFDRDELKDGLNWTTMFLYAHQIDSDTVFKRIGLLHEIYDL